MLAEILGGCIDAQVVDASHKSSWVPAEWQQKAAVAMAAEVDREDPCSAAKGRHESGTGRADVVLRDVGAKFSKPALAGFRLAANLLQIRFPAMDHRTHEEPWRRTSREQREAPGTTALVWEAPSPPGRLVW